MTFSFSEVVRVAYQSHVVGLLTPQTGYLLRGKDTRSNCVIAFPSTLNPPVSDHPKCEDSAGRWSLVRIEPQYTSSEGVLTLLLFIAYNLSVMCCSILVTPRYHTYRPEHRENNKNSHRKKLWRSRLQSRSGRLREISPTTELWLGKI